MSPRSTRDRGPDAWVKCPVCLGHGVRQPILDRPAEACFRCGGSGEVLAEEPAAPPPVRRRR